MAVAVAGRGFLVLGLLHDGRLGGQHDRGDRGGVLQRRPGDLGRVDDARPSPCRPTRRSRRRSRCRRPRCGAAARRPSPRSPAFCAMRRAGSLSALRTIRAPVASSPSRSSLSSPASARINVTPAAGHDALLDRGSGRRDGVLDAVLLLLELDLGGRADLDHRDAAGELGEPLLQLLAVPVGVGVLDLGLDLVDAAGDLVLARPGPRRSSSCPS